MAAHPGALPLVGNDVVDLDDPANAEAHLRARFVARVCTGDERAAVAASDDPRTLLWSYFAAKEAAYKVAAKLGPAPGFAHRAFAVAPDLRAVRYGALVMDLCVDVVTGEAGSLGRVHAVATTRAGDAPVLRGVVALAEGQAQSRAARDALCDAVSRHIGCAAEAIAVVRDPVEGSWDGFGPPRVLRDGRVVDGLDVSLSHDGRFVAFAATAATLPGSCASSCCPPS